MNRFIPTTKQLQDVCSILENYCQKHIQTNKNNTKQSLKHFSLNSKQSLKQLNPLKPIQTQKSILRPMTAFPV